MCFEDPMGIAGKGLRGMGATALDVGVTSPVLSVSQPAATAPQLNFWGKSAEVAKNVGNQLATLFGAVSPSVTALIQQRTQDKLAQTAMYQQQVAAGQQPTFPAGDSAGAKKLPTWVLPVAIGGVLVVGGLLLLGKKRRS